jgi:hypothetical protein
MNICNFDAIPGYPLTDAYAESLNGLIRRLKRTGRSHGFQALRARILLTVPAESRDLSADGVREGIERRPGIPGVHIPTLLKNLESNDCQ